MERGRRITAQIDTLDKDTLYGRTFNPLTAYRARRTPLHFVPVAATPQTRLAWFRSQMKAWPQSLMPQLGNGRRQGCGTP